MGRCAKPRLLRQIAQMRRTPTAATLSAAIPMKSRRSQSIPPQGGPSPNGESFPAETSVDAPGGPAQHSPATHWPEPETRMLRALVDNLDEAIVILAPDGTVRFVNAAAERIYGIVPESPPLSGWSQAYGIYLPDRRTLWPAHELPGALALRGQNSEAEMYISPPAQPRVTGSPPAPGRSSPPAAAFWARCSPGATSLPRDRPRKVSAACWPSSRTRRTL